MNTKKVNVVNVLLVKLDITSIYKNKRSQRQLLHWHPEKFNLVKSLRKDDALGAFFYSWWQLVPNTWDHVWAMKESTIIWSLYYI